MARAASGVGRVTGRSAGCAALIPASVLLLAACTLPRPTLAPTSELVHDPELAARVDALAAASQPQRNSEPGPIVWLARQEDLWTAVRDKAAPADLLALLHHTNPVVRAYAVFQATRVDVLRPLLGDDMELRVAAGCIVWRGTIGALVTNRVCSIATGDGPAAEREKARALLKHIGTLNHPLAQRALDCGSPIGHD
jgi:hypothetical protein